MKKALIISMLITVGIIVSSCGQKNPKATSNANNDVKSTTNSNTVSNTGANSQVYGTFSASGTISFTAGGISYSCSISKVIAASTSLTIQTSTADVKTNGYITVTCYTATSAINTGVYSAASTEAISSVAYIDKNVNPYSATSMTSGSSCIVNITALTSTSVKATFTATLIKAVDNSTLAITDGVIDCTIASK
jgi:hypothetical protein